MIRKGSWGWSCRMLIIGNRQLTVGKGEKCNRQLTVDNVLCCVTFLVKTKNEKGN